MSGISDLLFKDSVGKDACNIMCDTKYDEYAAISGPIRDKHQKLLAEKTTKMRMIENPNKRIVNFIFMNPFPVRLNEFSLRLRKFFDNKLDAYMTETKERINSYIEKIKNDELEDEDEKVPYPITQGDTPHLTIDITSVGRISLATADDPFFKLQPSHKKYFPQMFVYDKDGEILETIDESKLGMETITKGTYNPDCRDSKLKYNDDRRVTLSLLTQKDVQMVVFAIRSKDLSQLTDVKENEFDRAHFRLLDEGTNQTLDTSLIKDMKITVPTPEGEGDEEDDQPDPEGEEDDENSGPKPQNVIILGRAHLSGERWIYEQYNYMFKEDAHPDFFVKIGKMEAEARNFHSDTEKSIQEEEKALKEAKEAAAQAAAAKAASKKKNKKDAKKKKEKEDKEEEKVEEDKIPEESEEVDIDHMPGFKSVVEGVNSTVFGPVTLNLTEEKWDLEKTDDLIKKKLNKELGKKIEN